jgi:hypothetical protein
LTRKTSEGLYLCGIGFFFSRISNGDFKKKTLGPLKYTGMETLISFVRCSLCGIGDEFKFYLVKWSKICTLIFSMGLGVKNLIQFN